MSLDFDLTKVKSRLGEEKYDYITTRQTDRGKDVQRWHLVTDFLIWRTMATSLGEISETNLDEWSFRLRLLQCIDGADFVGSDDQKVNLTRKDLENHIGLKTNVTTEPRDRWVKRVIENSDLKLRPGLEGTSALEMIDQNS